MYFTKCIEIGRGKDKLPCHYIYTDGWITRGDNCSHYTQFSVNIRSKLLFRANILLGDSLMHLKSFILLICVLCINIDAQTSRAMLGPVDTQPLKRTSVFKINIQTNRFDEIRFKQIPRTTHWMENNNYQEYINSFVVLANNTDLMLQQIDIIYKNQKQIWLDCGGRYSQVSNLKPKKLLITIESAPFTHPFYGPNFLIAGIVDGNKIRVVIVHINTNINSLQNYKDLLAWEFGNWFQIQILGIPRNINEEIGSKSPCK